MNRLILLPSLMIAIPAATLHASDPKPRPAEIARLSAQTLQLGIARAGDALVSVGDRGAILRSGDGTAWQQSPAPVQATLTAVSFADDANGWAVGHDQSILHTADGGRTWALQHFNAVDSKPVLSVLALDAQRALAAGAYGLLLGTGDGGKTWTSVDAPAILEDGLHLNTVIKLGNGDLFVAGETGLIGVSRDGAQWTRLQQPYEGSLFGALPRGEKGALIFGLRGNALVSDDVHSGAWTRLDTGTVQSLFGGTVLADGTALLVGADGALLRVSADGRVQAMSSDSKGTLSSALEINGRWLIAGEQGVSAVPAK